MSLMPQFPIEVMPRDISGLRRGNTGVDYVHRFDSGHPGPRVMVNALTHGNEFCGMTALTWLLEHDIRPTRGALILSFANVEAYERFDPARPLDNRFIDRDLNRVWSRAILDGDDESAEVRRARALRPIVESVDRLLDVHSTTFPVRAMLVYQRLEKAQRLAAAIGAPPTHIVSPGAKHEGGLLIEFGAFGDADAPTAALVVECGQHFARAAGDVAVQTTLRFLDCCAVLDPEVAAAHLAPPTPCASSIYEISEVRLCKSKSAYFVRPLEGFEEFGAGELIGSDGEREIRAPYDQCAVLMPKAVLVPGREMVTLARRH